jgi:hypothetical protein
MVEQDQNRGQDRGIELIVTYHAKLLDETRRMSTFSARSENFSKNRPSREGFTYRLPLLSVFSPAQSAAMEAAQRPIF